MCDSYQRRRKHRKKRTGNLIWYNFMEYYMQKKNSISDGFFGFYFFIYLMMKIWFSLHWHQFTLLSSFCPRLRVWWYEYACLPTEWFYELWLNTCFSVIKYQESSHRGWTRTEYFVEWWFCARLHSKSQFTSISSFQWSKQ